MNQEMILTPEQIEDAKHVERQICDITTYHPESSYQIYQCNELFLAKKAGVSIRLVKNNIVVFSWDGVQRSSIGTEYYPKPEQPSIFRNGNWRILLDKIHKETLRYIPNDYPNNIGIYDNIDLYNTSRVDGVEYLEDGYKLTDATPTHEHDIVAVSNIVQANRLKRQGYKLHTVINSDFATAFVMVRNNE